MIKKIVVAVVLGLLLVRCAYINFQDEQSVIISLGVYKYTVSEPGLKFKLPWESSLRSHSQIPFSTPPSAFPPVFPTIPHRLYDSPRLFSQTRATKVTTGTALPRFCGIRPRKTPLFRSSRTSRPLFRMDRVWLPGLEMASCNCGNCTPPHLHR